MLSNMGLHVILNPAGSYSFVGSVPMDLGDRVKPTSSDIMAGRTYRDDDGVFAVKFPAFTTLQDAKNHAGKHGYAIRE